MRIENETKLDFKDVLIRPKRSTLKSRNEVDLIRQFNFKHSPVLYKGIPVMAANMDSTGTFEMADALNGHKMFTCIHKHYSPEDYSNWLSAHSKMSDIYNNFAVSAGVNDLDKLSTILNANSWIKYICLDVANGYTEAFVQFVARVRSKFPHHVIIAGNVVTGDMTEELILKGADIVKVGIGPGCFAPGQKVRTETSLKNIEDINIGEKVLTHTGSFKRVVNKFKFDDKKTIMNINGIKATPNHEFYVLHKKYRYLVTDENLHQYAEWIEAKNLTKEYLLLKHK